MIGGELDRRRGRRRVPGRYILFEFFISLGGKLSITKGQNCSQGPTKLTPYVLCWYSGPSLPPTILDSLAYSFGRPLRAPISLMLSFPLTRLPVSGPVPARPARRSCRGLRLPLRGGRAGSGGRRRRRFLPSVGEPRGGVCGGGARGRSPGGASYGRCE